MWFPGSFLSKKPHPRHASPLMSNTLFCVATWHKHLSQHTSRVLVGKTVSPVLFSFFARCLAGGCGNLDDLLVVLLLGRFAAAGLSFFEQRVEFLKRFVLERLEPHLVIKM